MKEFWIITLGISIGILFSKTLLYILDRICYLILGLCIRQGNTWVQLKIAKILGV
jgi:hypothetical protein